jgi:LCP family protein required for cell wall assembly
MPSVTNRSAARGLIARAQAGEPGARAELRALYEPGLRRTAERRLGGGPRAEAAAREAFAQAWSRLARFDPRRQTFDAWLAGLLRRHERESRARAVVLRLAGVALVLLFMFALLRPGGSSGADPGAAGPTPPRRIQPRARASAPAAALIAAGPTATASPDPAAVDDERVTLLIMGLDTRRGQAGPARADMLMLLTLDQAGGDAAMLSIPRDLYVDIPGYGPNRINSAFFLGELYHEPDGGPGLTVRTVESLLGIRIDHWAAFEFEAFVKGIDLIGGIDVDLPRRLYDPAFPTASGGTEVFTLPAGRQHLDGRTALKFVRTRHADNDFNRSARQRAVLLAIRSRLGSVDALAWLAPKLPGFLGDLGTSLRSDLGVEEIVELGWQALQVDGGGVRQLAIGPDAARDFVTPTGGQVLLPDETRLAAIAREFLDPDCAGCGRSEPGGLAAQAAPGPSPTSRPATVEPQALLAGENARVAVLNGTSIAGLEDTVAARLRQAGINVVETGPAPRSDYAETYLFDFHRAPATLRALAELLGVADGHQFFISESEQPYDVLVILGADQNR